jgi:hypothetical protein
METRGRRTRHRRTRRVQQNVRLPPLSSQEQAVIWAAALLLLMASLTAVAVPASASDLNWYPQPAAAASSGAVSLPPAAPATWASAVDQEQRRCLPNSAGAPVPSTTAMILRPRRALRAPLRATAERRAQGAASQPLPATAAV